jgi:hypothetical protein
MSAFDAVDGAHSAGIGARMPDHTGLILAARTTLPTFRSLLRDQSSKLRTSWASELLCRLALPSSCSAVEFADYLGGCSFNRKTRLQDFASRALSGFWCVAGHCRAIQSRAMTHRIAFAIGHNGRSPLESG